MIVKVASRGAGRGPSDIRRQTRALSLLTRFQRQPLPPPRQLINDGSSSDIRLSIFPFFFPALLPRYNVLLPFFNRRRCFS